MKTKKHLKHLKQSLNGKVSYKINLHRRKTNKRRGRDNDSFKIKNILKNTKKYDGGGFFSSKVIEAPTIETKIERLADENKIMVKKRWFRNKTFNAKYHKVKFGDKIFYINRNNKTNKYEIRENSTTNKKISKKSPLQHILESFVLKYPNPTGKREIYHQYSTIGRKHQFTDHPDVTPILRHDNGKELKAKFAGVLGSTTTDTATATPGNSPDPKIVSEAQKRLNAIREREEALRLREYNAQKLEEELAAKAKAVAAQQAAEAAKVLAATEAAKVLATAPPPAPGPSSSKAGGGADNDLDILPPHNKVIVKRRFNDENDKREFIILTLLPSNISYMSHEAPHFWYRLLNRNNQKTQHKIGDMTTSQILTGYALLSNKYRKYSGNAVITVYRILDKEKAFKEGIPIEESDDNLEYAIDKKLFTRNAFATNTYPISQKNFTKKTKLKFILEYPNMEDTTKKTTLVGWNKFKTYMYEDDPMQIRILGL